MRYASPGVNVHADSSLLGRPWAHVHFPFTSCCPPSRDSEQQTQEQTAKCSQNLGQSLARPGFHSGTPVTSLQIPRLSYYTIFKLVLIMDPHRVYFYPNEPFFSLSCILWFRFLLTRVICITAQPVSRETVVPSA